MKEYSKKNAYRVVRKLSSKYVSLVEFRINAPMIKRFYQEVSITDSNASKKIQADLVYEFEKLLESVFYSLKIV